MSNFTAEPWVIVEPEPGRRTYIIKPEDAPLVAEVPEVAVVWGRSKSENEANARLIAMAPASYRIVKKAITAFSYLAKHDLEDYIDWEAYKRFAIDIRDFVEGE